MQKIKSLLLLFPLLALLPGCASIFSNNEYEVTFDSAPKGASVEIVNRRGRSIFNGTTPVNVILSAKQGYFQKAKYRIHFSKAGYENYEVPLEASLDGWYFGNLGLFNLAALGLVVIDPLTGAMYRLKKDYVSVALAPHISSSMEQGSLEVYSFDAVPEAWKNYLERVY